MCDEAIDNALTVLKLILHWFVSSKMIAKFFTTLYAVDYFNEGSADIIINCSGMGILNICLNKINLDDKFHEDDPDTNILVKLLVWHIKFRKRKELKKRVQ